MTYSKDKEILELARAIISEGWTQGEYARTKYSKPTQVGKENACRFCAHGALQRARLELGYDYYDQLAAEEKLREAFGGTSIAIANDMYDTKKEHVFDTFTLAMLLP